MLFFPQNEFKIPLSDVPQITVQTKYAKRDPNLKDNWRGKIQRGVNQLQGMIVKVGTKMDKLVD